MSIPEYFPYKSLAVRDDYFRHYDALAARQWPIPSETRMVPTSHGDTFVRIGGRADAPPLVLLPGAGATSLMWAHCVGGLSEEYRTIAVDQIGEIGRSTATRPVRDLDDQLHWLNELFDVMELGNQVNLMGLSYGGALSAQFAVHYPQRLGKLVLLAPGNTILRCSMEFFARMILMLINRKRYLPKFARWIFADAARKDPRLFEETLAELCIAMSILAPHKTPIPPVMTDAEWSGLQVPALFVIGEHETIYPVDKVLRRLKRVAPQIKTEVIPGAGHDLTFVQPGLVNRAALEFLGVPVGAVKSPGRAAE